MPVDYLQIQNKIKAFAMTAPQRQTTLSQHIDAAWAVLQARRDDLAELASKVTEAARLDKSLRCAIPLTEPLTTRHRADGAPLFYTLLAADGSQANPSRHDPLPFGVINLGIIEIKPGQAETPVEYMRSEILLGDDVLDNGSLMGEDLISLQRDIRERVELAELAAAKPAPVLTLTDGTLDLFREPKLDARFAADITAYQAVLSHLADLNAVTAAYVDKPGSDMVVRLLELSLLDGDYWRADETPAFQGVRDASLFARLLHAGERSAVFGIQSRSAEQFRAYDHRLALSFFFLNVGTAERPWVSRVEIPAWVAEDSALLGSLQATLLQQCAQLGVHPYPYSLHRAHELAVVSWQDKLYLQQLIAQAVDDTDLGSNKQFYKGLAGRKGYGE